MMHACCMETEPASHKFDRWPRLRRIVACNGPNQKNQSNLDLHLVRRYKICHFPLVILYLCIGQNQKNQPNLVLYLVRSYKICHFPIVGSYLCIGQNQKNQPNLVKTFFVSIAILASTVLSKEN